MGSRCKFISHSEVPIHEGLGSLILVEKISYYNYRI